MGKTPKHTAYGVEWCKNITAKFDHRQLRAAYHSTLPQLTSGGRSQSLWFSSTPHGTPVPGQQHKQCAPVWVRERDPRQNLTRKVIQELVFLSTPQLAARVSSSTNGVPAVPDVCYPMHLISISAYCAPYADCVLLPHGDTKCSILPTTTEKIVRVHHRPRSWFA